MPLESIGLFGMRADECRRLLVAHAWGRVVLSIRALPAALPVNYRVGDDSKMTAALNHTVVAFEIDDHDSSLDPAGLTGPQGGHRPRVRG